VIELRAPFPWAGGKSKCADVVWRGLGHDVVNYVEPFAGSLAVLLGRPNGPGKIETVNDLDGMLCNAWRALKLKPDETAHWCDDPVSELDLHAKHSWLVGRIDVITDQLRADPHYCDPQVAGYWLNGICQWIGTGWCGVLSKKMPMLAVPGPGAGTESGRGVTSASACGLPAIGNDRGINGVSAPPCHEWFRALQARLRRVRVVCGDWKRVLGPSVLGKGKNVGGRRPCAVFLDPPYDISLRAKRIYNHDQAGLAAEVREWALEHGDDPELRVVLAGYFEEHAAHMPASWTVHRWKGARGYAGEDNDNREQESLWFSKYCLPIDQQRTLFG